MTVDDLPLAPLLNEAVTILTDSGVWSPLDDARALAAHVLGIREEALTPESRIPTGQAQEFRQLIGHRADRVPLGHLTSRGRLGGIEVTVNCDVFVPLPPTEILLAWALAAIRDVKEPVIVDLCTGTGAIALALAHDRPDAEVHAVDLDRNAVACALGNTMARAAAGDTPVTVYHADVAAPELLSHLEHRVDLLIANPPYVPAGDKKLQPEYAEHHPAMAIYSGSDGLNVIREILRCSARLLRPGGSLGIEHGEDQGKTVPDLVTASGFYREVVDHRDQQQRPLYTTAIRNRNQVARYVAWYLKSRLS
jgi:release factor glutamine methyltransferase